MKRNFDNKLTDIKKAEQDRRTELENPKTFGKGNGFWYEKLPTGRNALCFNVRRHGKKIVQKLILPEGVMELRSAT